jgi:hypothetical protein
MRIKGPALKFGMILHADEPGVARDFYDFGEDAIR